MKLKLLSIAILIAFGIASIAMLGGCGGDSKGKTQVESISVNLDIDWIKNTHTGIQPDLFWWGLKSAPVNIYGNTYNWFYQDSTNHYLFGYFSITNSEDSQLLLLQFCQDVSLKVNFNITPANATNKGLKFTAHEVDISNDTSYSGSNGGWEGAKGAEVDIDNYVTITQSGEITFKAGASYGKHIRITATTTDGSNKGCSFDVMKDFM